MSDTSPRLDVSDQQVTSALQRWLQRAVIGLNLCPFAKAVHVKNQIHYAVCRAAEPVEVLEVLCRELRDLADGDPEVRDTTLLILPDAFPDFVDFNDFLYTADRALRKLKLDGELQIASFHPQFQFADAEPQDISNYTNRAPYPVLHLLREASIDKAVAAFASADQIYEKNIATLQQLGPEGWAALGVGPDRVEAKALTPNP